MNGTESDVLVFGDGYFGNLRPYRHISERVCFIASLISNTLLAVLLVREKNETMKPYSRVLLINVFFDYLYTIVSMTVEMEFEMIDGIYIYVVNGLPKYMSPTWQKLSVSLWIFCCASACLVSVIEFLFRYFLVVKRISLSIWQLLGLAFLVALCAFIDASFFYWAMGVEADHKAAFGKYMTNRIWHIEGEVPPAYYGSDRSNAYFILFIATVSVQDTIIIAILILSTIASLATLRKSRHLMSAKVRYMHSQINRLMFAEVFSLVTVAVLPIGLIMLFLVLKAKYVGFGVLIALILQWIPGVNPITTIFLVGPYREKVFGKLWPARRSAAIGEMSRTALSLATTNAMSTVTRDGAHGPSGYDPN